MSVVFGAIAPHGAIAVAEACSEEEVPLAAVTRGAVEELGRRFAAASPEATIVFTPHNVHVEGAMAVILAGRLEGDEPVPLGFDLEAERYDRFVVELVRENRLGELLEIEQEFVEAAKADSFRQMLMLHGALGDGFDVELLSYECPTYFGMLWAAFAPRRR